MSSVSIMHVRTGERAATALVDEWLARHNAAVARCDDVLDAAVLMLTRPDAMPELALVGLTRLEPEEWAVLDYLRETWPHVVIVTYGAAERPPGHPVALHCATDAALAAALASGPIELCNRFSAGGPAGTAQSESQGPAAECQRADQAGGQGSSDTESPRSNPQPVSAPVSAAAPPARRRAERDPQREGRSAQADGLADAGLGRIAIERPMLTAAELAALLDEPRT